MECSEHMRNLFFLRDFRKEILFKFLFYFIRNCRRFASLSYNGYPFTTKDQDNDNNGHNCAVTETGAWWYNSC